MALLIALLIAFIFLLILWPLRTSALISHPNPSQSYEGSIQHVESLRSQDGPEVSDDSHAIIMTHGRKVERAIVMYHGYTNSPRQYEKLAQMFFERGYNVYVPRIPYHGNRDLLTKEIGKLTIDDLTQVCDGSIDIARGLGEEVSILGLSMGGVMASWNAQFRNQIDTVVVIVPSFAWHFMPLVIKPLINLCFFFPNLYLWWDPFKRANRDAPHSMYHKFSTRGMGYAMQLGLSILRAARVMGPKARRIIVLTNELDVAVDEWATQFLIKRWKRHGACIDYFQFPKDLKMEHDIIDPLHPYEKTDEVYRKIFEMIKE